MMISVIGAGYVGLSLAVLISQKYNVILFDVDEEKINKIKNNISPIKDKDIQKYLSSKKLKLKISNDRKKAFKNSDYVIVATPTNYDKTKGLFDTTIVRKVISEALSINKNVSVVIKSTVPLGFTNLMKKKHKTNNIYFSPEFLREGKALYDNLYPSRIVIGDRSRASEKFAEILKSCSKYNKKEIDCFFMSTKEAEAVKLFSNTFLAMRVSFFNELDTFSQVHQLSTKNIIEGVCSDKRIGNYYNNPSFGYGGYCLPKDTKQLLRNYDKVPNNLIKAIIESNETRKEFITKIVMNKKPKSVGIYKLAMKTNSDNFRESAVNDIIAKLIKNKIQVNLYEPDLKMKIDNINLISNFHEFIKMSDVILANRLTPELNDIKNKIFTRDIYNIN